MKITEPYSPTPRAKASAKPVSSAGASARQDDAPKRLERVGAERGRGFLEFAAPTPAMHRLHRAHDERQADEDQRDQDAERRVGDFRAERSERRAEPAVRRIERGERDAGDGGRQREGQVDQRRRTPLRPESDSAPAPRRSTRQKTEIDRAPRAPCRRTPAAPPRRAAAGRSQRIRKARASRPSANSAAIGMSTMMPR